MSNSKRFAILTAATFAVSMFVGASAFADSRHSDETWRGRDQGYDRSDRGSNNGRSISGVVDRIDYRYRGLWLRDDRTGRMINVDMRPLSRNSRLDINDLRRGDRVTLNGDWSRNGKFVVYEIGSVRTGRY